MQTPEGKVKAKVKKILKKYGEAVYYYMPVGYGMGAPSLDFIGWVRGRAFAIETKAPGKKPTARQRITIAMMEAAGAKIFIIDGDTTELADWLEKETSNGRNKCNEAT